MSHCWLFRYESLGSLPTPFASPDEESGEQKKAEETSKAPVSLANKEIEQGKELHEHNLQTPNKMLIDTQETSGTTIEADKCYWKKLTIPNACINFALTNTQEHHQKLSHW